MMKFAILTLPLILSACATVAVTREPSTYLMSSDKPQGALLPELEVVLKASKYEIKAFDAQSGILVTKPRSFTYGKDKSRARHTVQMRQEGGSFSLRIGYDCEYEEKGVKEWTECNDGDDELEAKIKRIETSLVHAVREKVD